MSRTVAVVAAVLLAAAAGTGRAPPLRAQDAPAAALPADRVAALLRTDHYVVSVRGLRVGRIRRALSRGEHGGRAAVVREFEVHLDAGGERGPVSWRTRTVFAAEGGQELLEASIDSDEAGRVFRRVAVRREARMEIETTRGGRTVTGVVAAPDVRLADEVALERLAETAAAREAGPVGASVVARGFDVLQAQVGLRTMSVTAADAEPDAASSSLEVTSSVQGAKGEKVRISREGALLAGALDQSGALEFRRADEAAATAPLDVEAIERATRVAVTGDVAAFADPAKVKRLVLSCEGDLSAQFGQQAAAAGQSAPGAGPARQSVRREGSKVVVEILRDAPGPALDPSLSGAALDDDLGLDLRDAAVRDAASAATAKETTRANMLLRIAAFVSGGIADRPSRGTQSAREILAAKSGDSSDRALLLVALCRASGIPARAVDGLAWDGSSFAWRSWVEACAGDTARWTPVDPQSGRVPADALRIACDAPAAARVRLAGLKFRVEAAERE